MKECDRQAVRSRPGEKVVNVATIGMKGLGLSVESFQQSGVLETLDGILVRQLAQLTFNQLHIISAHSQRRSYI